MVAQIVAKTDGVPLFVEELTKMMLESGLLRLERQSLPAHWIAAAARHSGDAARFADGAPRSPRECEINGTIGRDARPRVSIRGFRAVSTVEEGVLQRDLARLVDAEFLYQRGTQSEIVYIFKHALIQDAAYQSLLRTTRAQLHKRIAQC